MCTSFLHAYGSFSIRKVVHNINATLQEVTYSCNDSVNPVNCELIALPSFLLGSLYFLLFVTYSLEANKILLPIEHLGISYKQTHYMTCIV